MDRIFDLEAVKYKRFSKAANEERGRDCLVSGLTLKQLC